MTDITELALLVSKAKASVFTLEYISQFDPADIVSDDVDLRFEVDSRDTGTNVSIVDECGQAAKVIGALVEALEKAQQRNGELETYSKTALEFREAARDENRHLKLELEIAEKRIAGLEESHAQVIQSRDHYKRMSEEGLKQLAESRTVTVKPDDADEVREEGNQFLVVRHPGKVPVIKHPVGQLEDYLLQILKADPLATIDIVTHRYYGVGGQFVEDADEYLHEMGIKWEAE